MQFRNTIRNNLIAVSILLFLVLYGLSVVIQPAFLYNLDGSLREFGVGLKKKTVIPAWLLAIILSISCYFFVLYFVTSHRF